MTDRYERIRDALAMGPTPGPWQDIGPIGAGKLIKAPEGLIAVVYGPNVNPASEANAHLIAACDPDTIRELLAERDALAAAMSQAPAAGEEIMVNAAHDVYTLPLQPSGLSSGPRFVVHVPAPEQQPAAEGENS